MLSSVFDLFFLGGDDKEAVKDETPDKITPSSSFTTSVDPFERLLESLMGGAAPHMATFSLRLPAMEDMEEHYTTTNPDGSQTTVDIVSAPGSYYSSYSTRRSSNTATAPLCEDENQVLCTAALQAQGMNCILNQCVRSPYPSTATTTTTSTSTTASEVEKETIKSVPLCDSPNQVLCTEDLQRMGMNCILNQCVRSPYPTSSVEDIMTTTASGFHNPSISTSTASSSSSSSAVSNALPYIFSATAAVVLLAVVAVCAYQRRLNNMKRNASRLLIEQPPMTTEELTVSSAVV